MKPTGLPLRPGSCCQCGAILVAFGRKSLLGRSIADYDVIINHDPRNSVLLHERGTIKAKLGDQTGADADFRRLARTALF